MTAWFVLPDGAAHTCDAGDAITLCGNSALALRDVGPTDLGVVPVCESCREVLRMRRGPYVFRGCHDDDDRITLLDDEEELP